MRKIILASTSPRRKAILEQIGLNFTVDDRVKEDGVPVGQDPHQLTRDISREKAESVAGYHDDVIIIAADTIGVIAGKIIGKPNSHKEACAMLASLSGRSHTVITGFTVMDTATHKTGSCSVSTKVYIRELTEAEIDAYVKTGEPLDKAGAYAIQGLGGAIVGRIEGEYYNVMGLPLCALTEVLKEFGVSVL